MQTETNNKPLYKVLNEQRTQGNIEISEAVLRNFIPTVFKLFSKTENKNTGRSICSFTTNYNDSGETLNKYHYDLHETKANAEYTALAVNNLHILAEALEKFAILNEDYYKDMAGLIINAKEALKAIS